MIIKFLVKFFKTIIYKSYVLFLMGIMIWAAMLFYPLIFGFEGKEAAQRSIYKLTGRETPEEKMIKVGYNRRTSQENKKTDLGYTLIDQDYFKDHFHHVGVKFEHDKVNACVYCHGEVPHDKDKEIRSFLNMHSFSVSCEVCHVSRQRVWALNWYEVSSGDHIANPSSLTVDEVGTWSLQGYKKVKDTSKLYGAKISLYNKEEDEFFSDDDDLSEARNYMKKYKSYTNKERKNKKNKMHTKVLKDAFECDYCHGREQTYMDYAKLGYPPRRVKKLNDSAIVGMIGKYKKFYFPEFMDGGSGRRK
jgi:hypothetical protein